MLRPHVGIRSYWSKAHIAKFPEWYEEYQQYLKDLSEARKKARNTYWNEQSQLENDYIKMINDKIENRQKRDNKSRATVIKISMHTRKMVDKLQAKDDRAEQDEALERAKRQRDYLKKQNFLQTLITDSKRWPVHNDLKDNIVMPATILHSKQYLDKLQEIAFLADQSNNKALEAILDQNESEEVFEEKNSLLEPMY